MGEIALNFFVCNNGVHLTCLNQHKTSTGLFDKRLKKNKFCQPNISVGLKYSTYPNRKEQNSAIQKQYNYFKSNGLTQILILSHFEIHIKSF